MHSLFLSSENLPGARVIVNDKDQLRHLKNALRVKLGEQVSAFDPAGNTYICAVRELNREGIVLEVIRRLPPKISAFSLTLACAIPKNSRFDDIVDKLTQLGAEKIIPLVTERVAFKLTEEKARQKLIRWKKIAFSAVLQSQRSGIPEVAPVIGFQQVITGSAGYDLKLIPALIGERKSLRQVLSAGKPKNILALIGPEGDFSARELELAEQAGFIPVSLGDAVLRVETAAVAVASYIMLTLA